MSLTLFRNLRIRQNHSSFMSSYIALLLYFDKSFLNMWNLVTFPHIISLIAVKWFPGVCEVSVCWCFQSECRSMSKEIEEMLLQMSVYRPRGEKWFCVIWEVSVIKWIKIVALWSRWREDIVSSLHFNIK